MDVINGRAVISKAFFLISSTEEGCVIAGFNYIEK
jgi:hypothetical protein